MRLDVYLVENGYFTSRGRSKTAIASGKVKIDGRIVKKASKDVKPENKVQVEEGFDRPQGYFKLQYIQEKTGLINKNDYVLDIGSSAGGFLLYASEIAAYVRGIEFSRYFESELEKISSEYGNVSFVIDDIFTVTMDKLSSRKVDVILSDLTLEPMDSVQILERVLPLLKQNGKLLQVTKTKDINTRNIILEKLKDMGLTIIDVLEPEKQEIYIIAQNSGY
ncbi:RNA-binding S4 domain protein [Methanohalobium evestigatum Z-7303]|uniref:RNA-binding S4 domain protein n=1 Tax=Methanohalobium evestigatum (strain ATCC BAA-1072 / DSM 3721 / NBRC 107634 / OCM 161 / Z-7303) TaxID=644295 RepID=D7E9K4_METEZ|nr:SAM-dependent methyltransferase [Methanohalobium evestigatum]ADI74276.1 RNA-binding S4 domain protein [Methanohalobium evestigatum Z-7303]